MNILIAPDSFKGSASTTEVAQAIRAGILEVLPDAETTILPMADGGEGTTHALVAASHGELFTTTVHDPLGRPIIGEYGVIHQKTAVIELASASGLTTLKPSELNPYEATSYGTGELMIHALNQGIKHFIICLGGSATNDGGAGLLQALGFRFLDKNDEPLSSGGLALQKLHSIDVSHVDPRVREAQFEIACDVTNPLIGPNGASAIFGPQKGATPKMVAALDHALAIFADCIEKELGVKIHNLPGAGAAGGTAGGLIAFLNGTLKPGITMVTEALNLENLIQEKAFDLLLTGEGKIDGQTASGKVVAGLSQWAKQYHLPVIALAGAIEGDLTPLYEKGLTSAFSIADGPMSLEDSMEKGKVLLQKQTARLFRLITQFL
ncbi:glycerate kinase [Pullulanibacillus pueri]|uniref:Glycerate kinase n=1 Tax=Pullulanibacillus pueri TaxID=1437324 RepID=A0A8J2ZXT8_9BACL|nr:glycerate kinase [Pullulanibacillus pueri]MBM7682011.1 glycerate kinase [Pullulanibacillus pueri]GGH83745.1 glycerate kinase [Pullulanibacillus pueri]